MLRGPPDVDVDCQLNMVILKRLATKLSGRKIAEIAASVFIAVLSRPVETAILALIWASYWAVKA